MMGERQLRLVIDTNVWLDYFLNNRPGTEWSAKLIRRGLRDDVLLLYAPHAIQDVFYNVGLAYKRGLREDGVELDETWAQAIASQAWDCARTMSEIATMAGMDVGDLWLAFKYRDLQPDLEDDVVIAVAQRVKADYLVTNDKALIAKSPIATLSPKDMLAVLQVRG